MKKWLERAAHFYQDKKYMLVLGLTALCSYGYLCTHSTVGIDDTPYSYYFEEGLIAIVGRWLLFLLNKVVHISEYAPFLTDFAGVLFLIAAAIIWSSLFYSVFAEKITKYGYLFFSCIFISCPLLSEVYTYHLHNGISIGYCCCGISLCLFREAVEHVGCRKAKEAVSKRRLIFNLAASAVFLWISLGCYESFMIVWLVGICLLLFSLRLTGEKIGVFRQLFFAGMVGLCGMILRSIMISVMIRVFHLEYLQDNAVQRSVGEMIQWLFEADAFPEFSMAIKRTFVMYGVFGYAYYPIKIFVTAILILAVAAVWRGICKKDIWIPVLFVAAFVSAFLLVVIEGKATLYRSAQFLPIICGFGALILSFMVQKISGFMSNRKSTIFKRMSRLPHIIVLFVLSVVVWNQCADMNKWFYIDYQKYENAKCTVVKIADRLSEDFDTSKPITFTGVYDIPASIIQDAYVPYGTEIFYKMNHITTSIDEHLLEKFYRDYGVWVAQTPSLSVIEWGRSAFGSSEELVRFINMQGYSFRAVTDEKIINDAAEYGLTLPQFPEKGAIVDMGDYILINL